MRLVEGVARLAHLFSVEIPIGGAQLEAAFFLIDDRLDIGAFASGIGHRRRSQIGKKLVHRRNILRGLVLELVGSMVRVAEEDCALRPQFCGAAHDLTVVPFATVAVPRQRGLHDLLAQRSILERSERRLTAGVQQANDKLAFLAVSFRRGSSGRDFVLREAREFRPILHDNRTGVLFLEHVLLEGRLQGGQLGV